METSAKFAMEKEVATGIQKSPEIGAAAFFPPLPEQQSLVLDTPLVKSGEHNLKNAIISVLSEQWPLTARKIYREICEGLVHKVTYQGIHKALRQLREQRIVRKGELGHQLDFEWIEELQSYSEFLRSNYVIGKNTDFYSMANGDSAAVEYENMFLATAGILEIINHEHSKKEAADCVVLQLVHPFPIFGLSARLLEEFKVNGAKNRFYARYFESTKADDALARLWEKIGIRRDRNKKSAGKPNYSIVTRDVVIQLLTHPQFARKANAIFKNSVTPAEAIMDYSSLCLDRRYKAVATITKNPWLARELRAERGH